MRDRILLRGREMEMYAEEIGIDSYQYDDSLRYLC